MQSIKERLGQGVIRGCIFDLDGVLLDTMPMWQRLGERFLHSRGIVAESGLTERLSTMSLGEGAQYLQSKYGFLQTGKDPLEEIRCFLSHYYQEEAPLKPGVQHFLEMLLQNKIKLTIATASDPLLAELALKHQGIYHYFCSIASCETVGHGKEYPDIYLRALEDLQLKKEETIVWEDALHCVKTAKNAGFLVVAVYDESEKHHQSQLQEAADWFLTSFEKWEEA